VREPVNLSGRRNGFGSFCRARWREAFCVVSNRQPYSSTIAETHRNSGSASGLVTAMEPILALRTVHGLRRRRRRRSCDRR